MSDTDTAAPTAHQQMMDLVIKGDQAGAQALSAQVNREAGIDQPEVGHDPLVLAPMPDAPRGEIAFVERAATTLSELGPEGEALVQKSGGHTSQNFQVKFGLREIGIQGHRGDPPRPD